MSTTTFYEKMRASSSLSAGNQAYIDALYEDYLGDANSVAEPWRDYFSQLPESVNTEQAIEPIRQRFLQLAKQSKQTVIMPGNGKHEYQQAKVTELISAYRLYGHRLANTDPLGLTTTQSLPELDLHFYDLSEQDFDTKFSATGFCGLQHASLRDIYQQLQKTYCGYIGIEYMHIPEREQRQWLQEKFEAWGGQPQFTGEQKNHILQCLTAAEGLEKYLGTRYVGQKRFSIEGVETAIPMLDYLVKDAAKRAMKEVVIGMAHRGRLNVLVNTLGKPPADLFQQFEGKHDVQRSGDVKYHEGCSSDINTPHGSIHLNLAYNPSHLEIVSPVLEGAVRAKQLRHGEQGEQDVLPVVIHGDAAFAGQGVVMETFALSQVAGYKTGGTIHIVLNNQVGFTAEAKETRSTLYCTDIAKMIDAPIFHVNADHPEHAVAVMQLAFAYRMEFNRDVVIEAVCYRRHGHQEADEPMATQPQMYQLIKQLPTTRSLYASQLINETVITPEQEQDLVSQYRDCLDEGKSLVSLAENVNHDYAVDWTPYIDVGLWQPTNTQVAADTLQKLGQRICQIPEDFKLQAQVKRVMVDRKKMIAGDTPLDWGCAETLAYASLLDAGHAIRLSGQDCQRGTFAHRHAVLHDNSAARSFTPLAELADEQAPFEVINSVLSEEAVMGFECGYATAAPNDLIIWEGQFGDFANGAQVIVDQFLSSGEQKWGRLCGLVLLLPHGYEGGGPEHSSARLERYLQLCAQENMQVCVPTTPAQAFHMLRRQVLRKARKPLIVMTPKSLLRHKLATSTLADLADGEFQLVIPEIDPIADAAVKKVIICSGKVYYDLLQQRRELKREQVAIIRLEQLYPFPLQLLTQQLQRYKNAKHVVWCQEEPKNQGTWFRMNHRMHAALAPWQQISYVGRKASASPVTGYMDVFIAEQKNLVENALSEPEEK